MNRWIIGRACRRWWQWCSSRWSSRCGGKMVLTRPVYLISVTEAAAVWEICRRRDGDMRSLSLCCAIADCCDSVIVISGYQWVINCQLRKSRFMGRERGNQMFFRSVCLRVYWSLLSSLDLRMQGSVFVRWKWSGVAALLSQKNEMFVWSLVHVFMRIINKRERNLNIFETPWTTTHSTYGVKNLF